MDINFTEEQKRIFHFVEHETGHGIIDAVAGAGKTTTIMECARFVEDKNSILFCAFNTSIAAEIKRKFSNKGMNYVLVKTIHALGRHIIDINNHTGHPIKLENDKYNKLIKDEEVQEKLKACYDKIFEINGLDPFVIDDRQKFAISTLLFRINNRLLDINQKVRATLTKDDIISFEEMVTHFGIFNEIEVKKKDFKKELCYYHDASNILLGIGNDLSKRTMIIDYTDMLYLPYKWELYPSSKYKFIFIDECQDLSRSQLAIGLKYGNKNSRILAVGDPWQSIYGFTGADIESFKRIKDITQAVELPLTTCFRCPQKVIELAQFIRPDITGLKKEDGVINKTILEDVVSLSRAGDLIISRLKAPLLLLVFKYIDANIKIQIHADDVHAIIDEIKSIFNTKELETDILRYINGFDDLRNEVSNRWAWIIKKNAERIIDSTERKLHIESETKYLIERLDFLEKKYQIWKKDCSTLKKIIERIKEYISATNNPIKLSTIHRAKGLESDRVFILNYDELPFFRLEQKEWQKIQEVNLKYVAITRTKQELFLIESKKLETDNNEDDNLFDSLNFD